MPVWKRLVLVAASLGAGLAIVATVAGLTINWYYSHARPTRDWPEKDIQGLRAEGFSKDQMARRCSSISTQDFPAKQARIIAASLAGTEPAPDRPRGGGRSEDRPPHSLAVRSPSDLG